MFEMFYQSGEADDGISSSGYFRGQQYTETVGSVDGRTSVLFESKFTQGKPKRARRRKRTSFSMEKLVKLENAFKCSPYPGIQERDELSLELDIPESRIQVKTQST